MDAGQTDHVGEVDGAEQVGRPAPELDRDQVVEADGPHAVDLDEVTTRVGHLTRCDEMDRHLVPRKLAADRVVDEAEFLDSGGGLVQRPLHEDVHVGRRADVAVEDDRDASDDGGASRQVGQSEGNLPRRVQDRAAMIQEPQRLRTNVESG